MEKIKDNYPSAIAITGLITVIMGVPIAPVVLGIMDLVSIKNGTAGRKGTVMDIIAIVLGGIPIILAVIASIVVLVILVVSYY